MMRSTIGFVVVFSVLSLDVSVMDCAPEELGDPVCMLQTDRLHVISRHQFLNKQAPDEAVLAEVEAEAPADESAEGPAEESAAASAGESSETPAEGAAEPSAEGSDVQSAEESATAPAREALEVETTAEGEAGTAAEVAANAGMETGTEAVAVDDVARVPFLPSDYAIDGNSEDYLSDMEKRVAADAAGQPEMVHAAVPDEAGEPAEVEAEVPAEESVEVPAEVPAEESVEESVEVPAEEVAEVPAESEEESSDAPAVEAADAAGLEGFGDSGDNSADTTEAGALVEASSAPIVSKVNHTSFDDFGTNLYVMHNLSGLAGFGLPLEPVNGPDGNYIVDSNDPMGWRDYRPTEAPWPFDTPREEGSGAGPVERNLSASAYDDMVWEDYVHDDDNELDVRDPDEVYESMK